MTNLISLSSRKNGGKDLVGQIIQILLSENKEAKDSLFKEPWTTLRLHNFSNEKWQIRKFAYKLKKIVCELTGCSMEDLENPIKKEEPLGEEWRYYQAIDVNGSSYGLIFDNPTDCQNFIDNYYARRATHTDNFHLSVDSKVHSLRSLMQIVGTNAGRDLITPQIWVNATFANYNSDSHWILTDTRFPNEIDRVKKEGGLAIKIIRYKTINQWFADVEQHINSYKKELLNHVGKTTNLMTFESFLDYLPTFIIETKPTYNNWFAAITHQSETALADYDQFDYIIHNGCSIEELITRVKDILVQEKLI